MAHRLLFLRVMTPQRSSKQDRARRLIPAVHRMARRLKRRLPDHVDRNDLVGAGMLGLADALDKRCADGDDDFKAYALRRIRGEMLEELRRLDPLTRTQRSLLRNVEQAERGARLTSDTLPPPARIAQKAGVREADVHEARRLRGHNHTKSVDDLHSLIPAALASPEDAVSHVLDLRHVEQAVLGLPEHMQRALACYQHDLTLREVGTELGVSEARVCQLRKAAVAQLRAKLDVEPRRAGPRRAPAAA